jgi:hypothetical protein
MFLLKWLSGDLLNGRFSLLPIDIKCFYVSSKRDLGLIIKDVREKSIS